MAREDAGKPNRDNQIEMEDDAEYQRQFSVFVRCATEKGIELVRVGETIAGLDPPIRRGRRRSAVLGEWDMDGKPGGHG